LIGVACLIISCDEVCVVSLVWVLVSKRAVAVWRAHEGVVLGVCEWPGSGEDTKLIT